MKFLILCSYYQRPKLIKSAIQSVLDSTYDNWELAFVDDGSQIPGRPIVEDMLKGKASFYQTNTTFEEKLKTGSIIGKIGNEIVKKSDADAIVALCDDDLLEKDYLKNLAEWFGKNNHMYCYSKIFLYNYKQGSVNQNSKYNQWNEPIDPRRKLDISQVAWRRNCDIQFKEFYKFDETDIDFDLFGKLYEKYGLCHPTGFFSQYKSIHDYQLVWNKKNICEYNDICNSLAGVEF